MNVAVVGAGMGGLAAAVELAARGHEVDVFELDAGPGGKVAAETRERVRFDTGPSLLTMPEVLDRMFDAAGTSLAEELELVRSEPWFRYIFPDGTELDVHPSREKTLDEIESVIGRGARAEFADFLDYARRIWEAAAPNFIFAPAPTFGSVLKLGLRRWRDLRAIDPMRTMHDAIASRVSDWRLRWLLSRYATYVGSDPRQAPATLNCIAWLELGRGSWGVRGGMYEIARALDRVARHSGAAFHWETPVEEIVVEGERARGVRVEGDVRRCDAVVAATNARHLSRELLRDRGGSVQTPDADSMSGWTAVLRARRRTEAERPAHTVLFPESYEHEFTDIFERNRPPRDPTVYLCAQEKAHGRSGWPEDEPLFAMVNAPPTDDGGRRRTGRWSAVRNRVRERLVSADLIEEDDRVVWERTPDQLARRFPGSRGAIYGGASNSRFAAFERPANDIDGVDGLYLAGGDAHPGSGVPMALQSGRLAARAVDH